MAEYYTVLKKAIGGLDSNQAEPRRTVYDKARNALIGQLKAVDPPLTTAEISRQRLELEEAIRKVEREAASGPGPVRAPARPAAPPPAPGPRDEPRQEEYDARDRAPPEPRLAPEYAQDWDNRAPDSPAVDRRDRPNLPARRKRGYLEEDDREMLEREARPSRLPALLL